MVALGALDVHDAGNVEERVGAFDIPGLGEVGKRVAVLIYPRLWWAWAIRGRQCMAISGSMYLRHANGCLYSTVSCGALYGAW